MNEKQRRGLAIMTPGEETKTIYGYLEPFAEQGTEGIVWCVYDPSQNTADGKQSYDGLHLLEKGDLLKIFTDESRKGLAWEGTIDFDYEAEKEPIEGFAHLVVQRVGGCTVNGVQKGVKPDTWFGYFVKSLPAELTKAAGPL